MPNAIARAAALLLLATVASTAGHAAGAEPLRVSWGSHNAPPYAISENGVLVDGFIRDLGLQVARRLKTGVEFVNVPRTRYEAQLRAGEIDMVCIVNPAWVADPDAFTWTRPLFRETDVLVQRAADTPWKTLDDLHGKHLGTIRGYRYPTLEPLFAQQLAHRDDTADLDSNLQRLALDRVEGVVDADVPVRYWLLRHDRTQQMRIAPLGVSEHDVSCAISPVSRHDAKRIRAAVDRLVRQGIVDDLLRGYLVSD